MSQKSGSYLQEKLEAVVHRKENRMTLIFQKEKIKLDEIAEIHFLKNINPAIQKEITMENDELRIVNTIPDSFSFYPQLKANEKERLMSAYQLVQNVRNHTLSRLHLIICPDNIVFDQGLTPHFIHYGVKESLPPYEKDADLLLKQTKAMVAAIVDRQYSFDDYIKFSETLKLSPMTKDILEAESIEDVGEVLNRSIKEAKKSDSLLMTVSKKKWKLNRYVLLGVSLLLIPALIYSIYSLFFMFPKQERVVAAQESFLLNKYSDVVTELQPYEIDEIPKVTQYQLALSYIINESLTEDQKENVRNTVSLQSDPLYYEYWINIGRGKAKEALETARFLEDRDLILFGLLKYREQVKADGDLDSEERQQELDEIESEIAEYEEEMKALEEEQQSQPAETTEEPQQTEEKKTPEQKPAANDGENSTPPAEADDKKES
ncbi:type VII secretion protein EssB [Rossellomorea aquimaris]|uniref:type VII secretion protein EssB n=1 Tax=Rossellomorea aquimaris TaxID=189382 RepID=UPI0005C99A29|nr:type VII secretion protein EssB [Rossellomorea aquimaris]